MTEGEAATNGENATNKDIQDIEAKIIRQVEYYFGDYNLPRDKFLQEEVKNDDGWISMETMTKFKRLASLSTDAEVITTALRKSESKLIEIHESNGKIRRSPGQPLPIFDDKIKEETMKRTVYCKGFPKDGSLTLDDLLEYFKAYGPYETVLMRYFFNKEDKKQGFKGSVLVVFPKEEKAKEFMELNEVKFKDTVLIRKWHTDYVEEKKKEIEERRAKREARKKENQEDDCVEEEPEIELPKGIFLHFTGFSEGNDVTREDIKEALGESVDQCAWIDFSRGMTEGYLRFKEADFNKIVMDKLEGKIKVKEMEATLRLVEGEEEDEQLKKMKEARSRARASISKKRKAGGRGFQNKRRRM
ncbi:la protein homolog [Penaeus japonicus]|uniref:la protein homolog n=1 Tax=Penaeus japonicus TaxID=27405 RepID=UPI001C7167BE|nr:la protein homolog [Penaeus japonicus]XP_042891520.1 la protein homolog [Penaeus japonicus]XP_042891521.1 la protein homolog [Penaeus japonicus]